MCPVQVREVAAEAIARARRGDGPTLIEAETYRFRGHSLADPDELRKKEEKDHYAVSVTFYTSCNKQQDCDMQKANLTTPSPSFAPPCAEGAACGTHRDHAVHSAQACCTRSGWKALPGKL